MIRAANRPQAVLAECRDPGQPLNMGGAKCRTSLEDKARNDTKDRERKAKHCFEQYEHSSDPTELQ